MDKNTKQILKFITTMATWTVELASLQAQMAKAIAELADCDAATRRKMIDGASKVESGHERIEAILAELKRALGA